MAKVEQSSSSGTGARGPVGGGTGPRHPGAAWWIIGLVAVVAVVALVAAVLGAVVTSGTNKPATRAPSGVVATSLTTAITAEQQAKARQRDRPVRARPAVHHRAQCRSRSHRHPPGPGAALRRDAPDRVVQRSTLTRDVDGGLPARGDDRATDRLDVLITQVAGFADLTQAFSNLQAASRDNHRPAFQRCA